MLDPYFSIKLSRLLLLNIILPNTNSLVKNMCIFLFIFSESLDQITEVEKAFFSDGGIRNYLICASVFRKIVQAVSYAKKYFLEISHTKIKIDLETETKELFEVSVIQCIAKDLETHYVRDEQFMFFIIPYPKDSEKVFTCFPDIEKEYTLSTLFLEVGNYEE